jgi:hypothetical protein
MMRATILFLLTAILACAATIRLYLKDGEYQVVREYEVKGDRVRYYSVERGDWEEIPLSLVDLQKTESEAKTREESVKAEAATMAAEEKAEREARKEVERVPMEPGVYLISGDELKTIKLGESKVVTDKKRSILKVMSPLPMVAGKSSLEMDGEHSSNVVSSATPEFYIRLSAEERFGIIRMFDKKGVRVVEKLEIMPVTNEIVEQQDEVQVFRHQVGDGLYKIWPMKPLTPGEYAVVQYSPAGINGLNIQVWDFGYGAGESGAAPAAKQEEKKTKSKK